MPTRFRVQNHAPLLAAMVAVALSGCGFRFQAGLASVPSSNRPWTSEDFAHDVIANGSESCPAAGSVEHDPLFFRYPPCTSKSAPIRHLPRSAPAAQGRPEPLGPLGDGDAER